MTGFALDGDGEEVSTLGNGMYDNHGGRMYDPDIMEKGDHLPMQKVLMEAM